MSKKTKKKRNKKSSSESASRMPAETRASDSLTVFWAVTVMMVLVINFMTIGTHFYVLSNPEAEKMALLKGMLLFAGCFIGGISLIVLPILYRVREVPPPPGLTVFGICAAVAPILTVCSQLFR